MKCAKMHIFKTTDICIILTWNHEMGSIQNTQLSLSLSLSLIHSWIWNAFMNFHPFGDSTPYIVHSLHIHTWQRHVISSAETKNQMPTFLPTDFDAFFSMFDQQNMKWVKGASNVQNWLSSHRLYIHVRVLYSILIS